VAQLITGLDPERVRANVAAVRAEIAAAAARAGRDADDVQLLAAVKYLPADELGALAQAGVTLVGENRAQELERKVAVAGNRFSWDFIGALQSRRVRMIVPHVRLIHSLASDSALEQLARHMDRARPGLGVLIEVNVAGEAGKSGIAPSELDRFIERSPAPVQGLMTMPPLVADPEASRRWFAALRELAAARGLRELSMGTTQDWPVAVEEGATMIRVGSSLFSE
jgi:pyridoxal phosphate enzyme (YggS family)